MASKGKHHERSGRDEHERDRDHEHEREHSDRRGRDFPVFSKVRTARWLGSAPATAEKYARALAQWRQLPGAVSVTATDLGGASATAKPAGDSAAGQDTP